MPTGIAASDRKLLMVYMPSCWRRAHQPDSDRQSSWPVLLAARSCIQPWREPVKLPAVPSSSFSVHTPLS